MNDRLPSLVERVRCWKSRGKSRDRSEARRHLSEADGERVIDRVLSADALDGRRGVDRLGCTVAQHSARGRRARREQALETATALSQLYPESNGDAEDEDADPLVGEWASEAEPTVVFPPEPGFVQAVDHLPATVQGERFRLELLVAPGDFVTTRHPLARVWSDGDGDECARAIRRAVTVAAERDLHQDVGYGIRQLADIAVRALSPSVNDPTTAATAVGYLQNILEQHAGRAWPARVRRFPDREVTIVMRRDAFEELLDALVQIGRYATDARIVDSLLRACLRVRDAAVEAGAPERAAAVERCGSRIAARSLERGTLDPVEHEQVEELREALRRREHP